MLPLNFNLLFIALLFVCLIDGSVSFFSSLFSTLVIVLLRIGSLSVAASASCSLHLHTRNEPTRLWPRGMSRSMPQKGQLEQQGFPRTWPSLSVTQDSVTCLSCVLSSSSLSSLPTSFIDCPPIRPSITRSNAAIIRCLARAHYRPQRHLLSP